jgi:hypothetical protein
VLAHGGVLGVEARRQTGEAHAVDGGAILGAHGAGGTRSKGARGVDNAVSREVEPAGTVPCGGQVGRRRLFLDDNLGRLRAAGSVRRLAVRHDMLLVRRQGRGGGARGRGRGWTHGRKIRRRGGRVGSNGHTKVVSAFRPL